MLPPFPSEYLSSGAHQSRASPQKRSTWAQAEGTPLPLGATWIEDERAFNFAVYAEQAESLTLLLYSDDLANPVRTSQFDFVRNKSGRIWHCRVPLNGMRDARYYAYSVSGQVASKLHTFDPDKVLLDPYSKCVFFQPEFDRKLAMAPGLNAGNAGKAPLGVLTGHTVEFDWPEMLQLTPNPTQSSTSSMYMGSFPPVPSRCQHAKDVRRNSGSS